VGGCVVNNKQYPENLPSLQKITELQVKLISDFTCTRPYKISPSVRPLGKSIIIIILFFDSDLGSFPWLIFRISILTTLVTLVCTYTLPLCFSIFPSIVLSIIGIVITQHAQILIKIQI